MSLINVAYNQNLTWASRSLQTLEQQIAIPLFNKQPVELGMTGQEPALVTDLNADPTYAKLFQSAFPDSEERINIDNIIRALASFVRSIIAADSAFDRLLYLDDQSAISESARRGMRLFFLKNSTAAPATKDKISRAVNSRMTADFALRAYEISQLRRLTCTMAASPRFPM